MRWPIRRIKKNLACIVNLTLFPFFVWGPKDKAIVELSPLLSFIIFFGWALLKSRRWKKRVKANCRRRRNRGRKFMFEMQAKAFFTGRSVDRVCLVFFFFPVLPEKISGRDIRSTSKGKQTNYGTNFHSFCRPLENDPFAVLRHRDDDLSYPLLRIAASEGKEEFWRRDPHTKRKRSTLPTKWQMSFLSEWLTSQSIYPSVGQPLPSLTRCTFSQFYLQRDNKSASPSVNVRASERAKPEKGFVLHANSKCEEEEEEEEETLFGFSTSLPRSVDENYALRAQSLASCPPNFCALLSLRLPPKNKWPHLSFPAIYTWETPT